MAFVANSQIMRLAAPAGVTRQQQSTRACAVRVARRTAQPLAPSARRSVVVASISGEEPKVAAVEEEVVEPKESLKDAMAFSGTAPELINGRYGNTTLAPTTVVLICMPSCG